MQIFQGYSDWYFKKINELESFNMDWNKEEKTQPEEKLQREQRKSPSNVLQWEPPSSLSHLRVMPTLLSAGRATMPSTEAEGDKLGEDSVNRGFQLGAECCWSQQIKWKAAGQICWCETSSEERKNERQQRFLWGSRYVRSMCVGVGTGDRWHRAPTEGLKQWVMTSL